MLEEVFPVVGHCFGVWGEALRHPKGMSFHIEQCLPLEDGWIVRFEARRYDEAPRSIKCNQSAIESAVI